VNGEYVIFQVISATFKIENGVKVYTAAVPYHAL